MKDINYGYSLENGQKVSKHKYVDYGCKCNQNDNIEMILNLKKKQISFVVNNIDLDIMYNDIEQNKNIKYKLAIFLKASCDSITLKKYQEIIEEKKPSKKKEN